VKERPSYRDIKLSSYQAIENKNPVSVLIRKKSVPMHNIYAFSNASEAHWVIRGEE